jgi:hypothetical protein
VRRVVPRALALAAVAAIAGLLAAQPVLIQWSHREVRGQAQAYVVLDTTRSMLAAAGPGAPTRLDRGRAFAERLRDELPGVPVGVASLTDRLVPHLFPTLDGQAFDRTVEHSVRVEQPPPRDLAVQATHLDAIAAAGAGNYFSPDARHRLLVLCTDGETAPLDAERLASGLGPAGVSIVVVRLGRAGESLYDAAGRLDPGYRPPSDAAAEGAAGLAALTGAEVFGEGDQGGALAAARRGALQGPVVDRRRERERRPLAGWLALGACVGAGGLAARRLL